ncbi:MAG: hypothetical protein Fur0027_08340 [Raineya sp.]
MKNKIYLFLLFAFLLSYQSYSQAVVVRPFGFAGEQPNRPGVSIFYFSMGRASITAPSHRGLSFSFTDENPDAPRLFEGVLTAPTQNVMREYEIGLADIHTKSNFVVDLFQYAWGRNQNNSYRYDRISTGMGFQFNLGTKVWLRQVNYVGIDWLGNILLDDLPVDGGISGNLWLNGEVYSDEGVKLRMLIRQTQVSYRPQVSLGLKFARGFLLSLHAGYAVPIERNDTKIILKSKSGETENFSRTILSAERINLRYLSSNAPVQASSFQLNRWYFSVRLAIHTFSD